MKIVIDMNLSPEWEPVFSGYCEIKHWSRIGDSDTPDEFILHWAKENRHVILTNDLDFGAILAATHFESPSVFQIRSQILDPLIIGTIVLSCFQHFEQDLKSGAVVSYDPKRARVRRLPL